ncbi:PEP/pyruvate-binding domain-containing protein [Spelaeicoccus albus]|uniref:Pyruvate,water dikinase n=1 Tax=Spelaeicoccus albus TaxID=1280376 RepID=A0A7Z0II96_9MICO|nr:PEP/pyruvate-binding domain-containing protein [Spelaeicoccus albus]NYI68211.1 pyruvate,water dikinase [Spelaeicoccus albus]
MANAGAGHVAGPPGSREVEMDDVMEAARLGAVSLSDADAVGRKAAALGELIRAGFTVPDGVVLPRSLFNDPAPRRDGQGRLNPRVEEVLASIADRFAGAPLAVRSSAPDEDGDFGSMAGAYDSVLDVNGLSALRSAVLACRRPSIALIVQRQVDADAAGVAFSANPVTGERNETIVEAVRGLGRAATGGMSTPERWTVTKAAATVDSERPPVLNAARARAVAGLADRAEELFGAPQDIEWAVERDTVFIVQSRPITALPTAPRVTVPPGTWLKGSDRYPEPMTEFGATAAAKFVGTGLTAMFTEFGALAGTMDCLPIGGEMYQRLTPVGAPHGEPARIARTARRTAPPWWLIGLAARVSPELRRRVRRSARRANRAALARDVAEWQTVGRLRLRRQIDEYRAIDLTSLSNSEAADHLRELTEWVAACMNRHFLLIPAEIVPLYRLAAVCRELLGWDESRALALVAGFSGATSAPAHALAAIGERARAFPDVAAELAAGADPSTVLAAADPVLADDFEEWRGLYGLACISDDPGSPTLGEQPELLGHLLTQEHSPDAYRHHRADALDDARLRLRSLPRRASRRFETARQDAVDTYWVREDAAFWTSSLPGGLLRLACMDAGRRFVADGRLDRAEDVVHLDAEFVMRALCGDPDALRPRVNRSRAERAWTRAHPGPSRFGPPPSPPPNLKGLPRTARILNEALLWSNRSDARPNSTAAAGSDANAGVSAPPTAEIVATGLPGSPGIHTGRVRIVRAAADLTDLRRGDVMVCPTTDPGWAVVFDIVGALVTESGGVLSHAAIVAREFDIPAVLATGDGSKTLLDGDLVTVDGTAGIVRIARPE